MTYACVCVCRWICQITNQRLDKGHMCASLCISPTYLPHRPLHVYVKTLSAGMLGLSGQQWWHHGRLSEATTRPQRQFPPGCISYAIPGCGSMTPTPALLPARFMSLQTFNTDKQLICLNIILIKRNVWFSHRLTMQPQIKSICLQVTRDLMNDLTPNESFNETPVSSPAWGGLRSTARHKGLDCLQRDRSAAWG